MADSKDPKANEARPGAVKPPVLDLKARAVGAEAVKPEPSKSDAGTAGATSAASAAGASKPAGANAPGTGATGSSASADRPKPGDKSTEKPKPKAVVEESSGFGFGAALVGGLLGLGAAYGLAYAGLWPTPPAPVAVADPRLADFGKAIPELETVTQTTQSELATLNQRIAALEQAEPAVAPEAAAPLDLGGVQSDIAALSARVDSLAEAPATAANSGAVDALRGDFTALGGRIDELAARVGTAEASLRTLEGTVSETSATLAKQPGDIGAVLQLPLILSGLETAFATGRPYETEIATLRAAAPKADIPTLIANQAAQGLTRPDVIAREFDAVLPAILAGRPSDPDAQWQDGALDWLAGAIALRPTGEIDGDTPDAITSRLIGAVERRDFASAQSLLESLPPAMQAAAGDVPALIAEQAQAEAFLQSLRNSALSGEVAQ